MKRSIISFLVMGLCTCTATAVFAQAAAPEKKSGETSQSSPADQQGMTSQNKDDPATSPGKSKHDKGDAAFKKADKDNDGTLDRQEAKAMPNVAKNFDAIDADKDGTVSLDEVHTYMKAKHNAANNN